MTEVEVKHNKATIQVKKLSKISLNTPNKADNALEDVKKIQEKPENRVLGWRNLRAFKRLAEKVKYNPNYLLETKFIEETKLKLPFRSHFSPVC